MDVIPTEVVDRICTFIFGQCQKCHSVYHYSHLVSCVVSEYKSIFEDDYGLQMVCFYEHMCDKCTVAIRNDNRLEVEILRSSINKDRTIK